MSTVLVIDNYDSFTYNLVQYVESSGTKCDVFLNDRITPDEIREREPSGILISPGPGTPDDAGVTLSVLAALAGVVPIFGVCLGHQAIGQHFGAKVVRAEHLMHGKTSLIEHDGSGVFAGLPSPFEATRYHSLVVDPASLPEELVVHARTGAGEIMGLRHRSLAVEGVQFHPESILSEHGMELVRNWLETL